MRKPHQLNWKIASITGHRDIGPKSLALLRREAAALAKNPTIDAIALGGARGVDTEFLKTVYHARDGKRPWLIVVVPDTVEKQPWEAKAAIRTMADEVIELGNPITSEDRFESFRTRNVYLVELCSLLVACWDGNYKSGTGHAVKVAEAKNVPVVRIPMSKD